MKDILSMSNEIKFVKATEDDIHRVYDMMIRTKMDAIGKGIFQWTDTYPTYEMIYQDVLNSYTEIIKLGDQNIGFFTSNSICEDDVHDHIKWLNDDKWIILHRLCITPPFQNKGIGTNVLLMFEDRAINRGYKSIRIDVFSTNEQAIYIYQKLGYIRLGEAFCDRGKFYIYEKIIQS